MSFGLVVGVSVLEGGRWCRRCGRAWSCWLHAALLPCRRRSGRPGGGIAVAFRRMVLEIGEVVDADDHRAANWLPNIVSMVADLVAVAVGVRVTDGGRF